MAAERQRRYASEPSYAVAGEVSSGGELEIDLLELLYRLAEKIGYIILAVILGGGLMAGYSFYLATPVYETTAKLYVLNSSDSVVNLSDLQIGSYLASDYQEVFKTWEVNERVISNLNLPYSYKEMQDMLTISNPSNTRILYITIRSTNPTEAALIANEYADVVRQYVAETMSTEAPNILSTALVQPVPVSPNKTRNIVLGALVGALIAVAIITIRFLMDDKIKSSDDISKYIGIPTLAVVPILGNQNILKIPEDSGN